MSCKDMRISAYPRYKSDVTTCECPEGYKWHLSERLNRMKSDTPALVKDRVLAWVRRPFLAVSPNRPSFRPGWGYGSDGRTQDAPEIDDSANGSLSSDN